MNGSEASDFERSEIAGPPELAQGFEHVRARPFAERLLAFELLVPKAFATIRNLERCPKASGDFEKIGAFMSPQTGEKDAADSIDISVAQIGRDVGLADFFAYWVERYSLRVLSVDPLEYGDREAVDALTQWTSPDGVLCVTRLVIFRNGLFLVRIAATAAAKRYAGLAEAFAVSLSTFKFLECGDGTFLEPYAWASSIGALPLGFRRPLAWKLEELKKVPWGREVLDLRYLGGGELTSAIRAKAIDRDIATDLTIEGLAKETLDELRATGLALGALRQRSTPPSPGPPFEEETLALVHDGRAFGGAAEARVVCLRTHRVLYALGGVIPGKDLDRIGWMAGKRALDVAFQTLNRPEDELLWPHHRAEVAPPRAGPTKTEPSTGSEEE